MSIRVTPREDFWDRVFQLRRLSRGWHAAIVLLYPLLTALGVGLDWALSGRTPDVGILTRLMHNPGLLLSYLGFVLLLGPFPEELG